MNLHKIYIYIIYNIVEREKYQYGSLYFIISNEWMFGLTPAPPTLPLLHAGHLHDR